MKDIQMAQKAGVLDVWAKYGTSQHKQEYALLRKVTHWTDQEVEKERAVIKDARVVPTYTLHLSFKELLDLFEVVPFREKCSADQHAGTPEAAKRSASKHG
jgi:phosphoglycolate phosphatase